MKSPKKWNKIRRNNVWDSNYGTSNGLSWNRGYSFYLLTLNFHSDTTAADQKCVACLCSVITLIIIIIMIVINRTSLNDIITILFFISYGIQFFVCSPKRYLHYAALHTFLLLLIINNSREQFFSCLFSRKLF